MQTLARTLALCAVGSVATVGLANTIYTADLTPLNNSNVTGTAILTLSDDMSTLTVEIYAENLEPDMPHPQHIHGLFNGAGQPMQSVLPTLADDTDGDGYIELAEGLVSYGPVLVPLTSPPGGAVADFPTAPDGIVDFTQTYDLTNPAIYADGYSAADLFPLNFREIVMHGMTVPDGPGAGTPGEVDGVGGYKAVLPIAAGVIVPEPATGVAVLLALSVLRRR